MSSKPSGGGFLLRPTPRIAGIMSGDIDLRKSLESYSLLRDLLIGRDRKTRGVNSLERIFI